MPIPFIIIGIIIVAYLGYMKFYYPKFKQKYEENEQQVAQEWKRGKEKIISEYFSNPDKFGLIAEATKGANIIGMISGKISTDFKSKLLSGLKDAFTFTSKVDMAHYYLVATDQGLHYMGFDGDKCFINEVFDYDQISHSETLTDTLTFDYKEEKLKFAVDNDSPIAIDGYPRFQVHERLRTPTANDRNLNYFVREYFAFEPTHNAAFSQGKGLGLNTDMMKVSPEKTRDFKVREYLVQQFKQKMKIV